MTKAPMTAAGGGRLRAHIFDDQLSKIARVRQWWCEIERLKSEGVSDQVLVNALAKAGVPFTSRSAFATTLARVRKEVQVGKFRPAPEIVTSGLSSEPQPQLGTAALSTVDRLPKTVSPSNSASEIDIYAPRLTKKERREQKAARIPIERPENNPLFAAILKGSK